MRLFWGLCRTIGLAIGLASIAGGAAADTLGKVRDSGKLVIGHREASRPFSFINDDGQVAGYSIDLCRRVANAVKVAAGLSAIEIEFKPVSAENRMSMLVDGEVDIVCGSTTNGGSFRLAAALAESFDADYVAHVSAVADCDALAEQDVGQLNAVQAVSEPLVSALETQLRIASDKVSLVRLGVKASTEVACYAHPERTPSILCTSAFERNRGVNHLIEAIGLLRDRGHTALAFLLGRGSSEKQLRKMVAERKLGPWITFANPMGGLVEAMQSADIFVRPSVHTVVSAYPLQAMGAGMAVVTFASGVCDHFRHNETAIVCSEPTPKSLADGIEVLLANKQQAREMATRGVAYVREHHSMSGMAERTSALYRQLALARATFPIRE